MSATVEAHLHLVDNTLAVGERAFNLHAATAGAGDIDGSELAFNRAAGQKFRLVLLDVVPVVKNILLGARAGEFKFAGGGK